MTVKFPQNFKPDNISLFLEKHPDRFVKDLNSFKNFRREHFEEICELSKNPTANYEKLKNRYFIDQRWSFTLKTKVRLIVGFSGGSVLENSISFHPFYGFPIIPSSGLKGVTRHYCSEYLVEKNKIEKTTIDKIFGNNPEAGSDDSYEGDVIFFDAWPEEWERNKSMLELDIMTPHYPKYYQGLEYPTDKQSPKPIVFLAVKKGITFRFCLKPSSKSKEQNHVNLAECFLKQALKTFGVGAKTGSNYGYFE